MVLNLTGTDANENSSFVTISDPMGKLNFGPSDTRSTTLAAWVYMNASVNHNTIFSQGEWKNGISLTVKGDTATSPGPGGTPPTTVDDLLWVGDASTFSSAPVPIQQWTHVAATFTPNGTNTDVAFYVNGVARGGGQFGGIEAPVNGSAIGREWRNATLGDIRWIWGGRIDDLMVFESALDLAGIVDAMNGNVAVPNLDVLQLQVDPVDGEVQLKNTSANPITLNSYRITSATSALNAAGWNPVSNGNELPSQFPLGNGSGNGWEVAENPNNGELVEWYLTGNSTLNPDQSLYLGTAFNPAGVHDVALRYTVADLTVKTGDVEYMAVTAPGVPGDYNNDGTVNAADYVVWRDRIGLISDLPNDLIGGTIDDDQYNQWRANFGKTSTGGPAIGAALVPEPATLGLLMIAAIAGTILRRRC
jgi:hypothetical protein